VAKKCKSSNGISSLVESVSRRVGQSDTAPVRAEVRS
jgi:hypothetical protein